jgi:hypothetical protein
MLYKGRKFLTGQQVQTCGMTAIIGTILIGILLSKLAQTVMFLASFSEHPVGTVARPLDIMSEVLLFSLPPPGKC